MKHLGAFVFVFLLFAAGVSAEDTLILNTPGNPPYHFPDQSGIIDQWMQNAFARIGRKVMLESLPPERALLNANQGLSDGDALRIGGLSQQYQNLIQVPEKVYVGEFVAFRAGVSFATTGWDSLRPYNVGIVRGHKICEANIHDGEVKSLIRTNTIEQLFTLLKNERAEVVVTERVMGEDIVSRQGLRGVETMAPPLARLDFFLYLHKKHSALVPAIGKALQDMKKDGSYQRIYDSRKAVRLQSQ